jgi:3-phosphoglycerate kinase
MGFGMMARMTARRQRMMAARRMRRRRRRRRRRRIILGGGLIALGTAAVYKFSKRDVEKIEQATGKSAEELSDEELKKAIEELHIKVDELSDQEWDEVEKADAEDDEEYDDDEEEDDDGDDYLEELERLAELHKKGILTDEEFEAKKKQLLGL